MDVKEAINVRRSIRSYQSKNIPSEVLWDIVNAGRLAPSASNKQDWIFILVKNQSKREELASATSGQGFIKQAPVILAGVTTDPEYQMRNEVPSGPVDLAIALDHITLRAAEEGIGSCWIGAFYQDEVKDVLSVPEEYQVIALLPLGYPEEELAKGEKARKDLDQITCRNTFQNPES